MGSFDLTPDHVDAVIRDPNAPDDVRATVAQLYAVSRYLDSVDFSDDGNGFLTTVPRSVDTTAEEVPAEAPAEAPPAETP